jgi:hypothetical protein
MRLIGGFAGFDGFDFVHFDRRVDDVFRRLRPRRSRWPWMCSGLFSQFFHASSDSQRIMTQTSS